jgi:hypothetical protein
VVVSTAAGKHCRFAVAQTCTTDANCPANDTCGNDDAPFDQPNHCRTASSLFCLDPSCGDDVTDNGEGCDQGKAVCNGGTEDGKACGTPALLAACTGGGGTCEDPSSNTCNISTNANPGVCNTNLPLSTCSVGCAETTCGDGITNGMDECDDGTGANGMDPSTCTSTCKNNTCGDSEVLGTEECDDGSNASNNDACISSGPNDCKNNVCGDGYLFTGQELCEPASGTPGTDGIASCDAGCCPTATINSLTTNAQRFAAADCALDAYEALMQTIVPELRRPYLQKQVDSARAYADQAEANLASRPSRACYRLRSAARRIARNNQRIDVMTTRGILTGPEQVQLKNQANVPSGWYNIIRQANGCPVTL